MLMKCFLLFSVQLCWSDIRAAGNDSETAGAGHRLQDHGPWHGVNARQEEGGCHAKIPHNRLLEINCIPSICDEYKQNY